MSILLTIMPPWGRPTLPIGLGYLSRYLDLNGVEHRVQDHNLGLYEALGAEHADLWRPQRADDWVEPARFAETLRLLEPHLEAAVEQLAGAGCGAVGFSVNQSNARLTIETARRLRERCPRLLIVFGGLGIYVPGERRLVPEGLVDLFVMGEGEHTLLELCGRLERGDGPAGIAGSLTSPTEEEFEPRPPLDLRNHAFPTYDRFKVQRYPVDGAPMPIGLSRGCVCRCAFCGDYPFWGKFRSRRGGQVAAEIKHHVKHYGVREFEFNDLAINGDPRALEEMCDGIIEAGLTDIRWSSYAYVHELRPGLAARLRRAGCTMLRFGMESASDAVLRRMRKPHRAAQAAALFAELDAVGILCNIGLMVGFPDETDEEVEETCAFLCEHQRLIHEVDSLSVFYIKPLSQVDRRPERFGVTFPEDNAVRWNHWIGRDGSTLDQRVARARRVMAVLESTSITFQRCNTFGF